MKRLTHTFKQLLSVFVIAFLANTGTALAANGGTPNDAEPPVSPAPPPANPEEGAPESPFHNEAQWIWMVNKAGGTAKRIAKKAQKYGFDTVFVKSGDGTTYWKQFDKVLPGLQKAGLRVCGWQFVYGSKYTREARVAARAIKKGADCFIVNAEIHFERRGKYKAARRYMKSLRKRVGPSFPIGLSSFPYVHYHGSFPYSAFLEPPYGAQFNMPQVYWRAIGTKVSNAMRTTFRWNSIYDAKIAPTAGVWLRESRDELKAFRRLSAEYGAVGTSYWSMQHTFGWQWPLLANPLDDLEIVPQETRYPILKFGSKGDPVYWLQGQLREWGHIVKRTGYFKKKTRDAVTSFQETQGLKPTGEMDKQTWELLLQPPDTASTATKRKRLNNGFREPESSGLPPKRNEIASKY